MDYKNYYENQAGSGVGTVFHGSRYQKGHGLGNIFRSFIKWVVPIFKTHAVPLIKRGAQTLGSEAIRTATNVANDTLNGKTFEESAKERVRESISNLSEKALSAIQSGSGKRKRKRNKKSKTTKTTFICKTLSKKRRRDIFD